jgi:small subunit ribosomal protein S6
MEARQYEALYILHPHLNEEDVSNAVTKVEDLIKNLGGKVEKAERQGRKKIAFTVKKLNDGFFVLTHFDLPADKVVELRHQFKLNDQMLRYFLTRKAS